jgi:hypothetical protein
LSTTQNTRSAEGVGLGGHDLGDQPIERLDPGGGFAAAEQAGVVDIPGGQVGQRAAALVLVLDAHAAGLGGWQSGVAAAAGLDGGLLIGADDVLIGTELRCLEDPLVQVQDHPSLGGEVGVAGKDPRLVLPGLDRVLGQPAPQRRGRDVCDQAAGQQLGAQLRQAPA